MLDSKAIATHGHLEETVDTPVSSPRIATPPEWSSVSFDSKPSDRDLMVDERESYLLRVDSSGVVLEGISDMDTTRDRSILGDFSLHLVNSLDTVVVTDIVTSVRDCPAFVLTTFSSRWRRPGAVLTFVDRRHCRLEIIS